MPKNEERNGTVKNAKRKLGVEIAKCRGATSQRKLAGAVGLPPSNMKYIEDGVNAPSSQIYEKLIATLQPTPVQRRKMDHLYTAIRKTPPPDVCKVITDNEELNDAVRLLEGQVLTASQIEETKRLFNSFKQKSRKGATENG